MLTNKTSRFLRSISLVMAVLMVLAVCLTGCTDADAQAAAKTAQETADAAKTAAETAQTAAETAKTAADTAQTTADSKTTTEAVADQITAALVGYLKADSALTEADVKKLIEASLPNLDGYTTAEELTKALAKYATSDSVTSLESALKTKVTTDDVKKAIDTALATYSTKAYVDEQLEDVKSTLLTLADVENAIAKALENYYSAEEINAKIEDLENLVASYFNGEDAETVATAMGWLLEAYADNKDFMSLTTWNEVTKIVIATIDSLQDLYERVEKGGYLQENIEKINTYIAEAYNLDDTIEFYASLKNPTDKAKLTKLLEYRILRCATLEEVETLKKAAQNAIDVPNFSDEWNAVLDDINDVFTEKDYVYDTENGKKTNVATWYDKPAFYAVNEAIDDLLVTYNLDEANPVENTDYETVVYYIVKHAHRDTADVEWGTPVTEYKTSIPADTDYDKYTKVDTTVAYVGGVDLMPDTKDDTKVYSLLALNKIFKEYAMDTVATAKYGTIKNLAALYQDGEDTNTTNLKTYYGVYAMIQDCQNAINAADAAFADFLVSPLNFTKEYKGLGDKTDVATACDLLKAYMCSDLDAVSDLKNVATQINGDNGEDGKTLPAEDAWLNIVYLDNYYLYRSILNVAFDASIKYHQANAAQMLIKIHNDYYAALVAVAQGAEYDAVNDTIDYKLANDAAVQTAINSLNCSGVEFLNAFFKGEYAVGETTFTWTYADTTGPAFAFPGLTALANKDAIEMALANIKANAVNLNTELGAAIYKATAAIQTFDIAAAKASGVSAKDAFKDILQGAVESLNEVYYRYIIEAMKKACKEALYVDIDTFIATYVTDKAGVKDIYADGYATIRNNIEASANAHVEGDTAAEYALADKLGLDINDVTLKLAKIDAATIVKKNIEATGITFEGTKAMKQITTIYNEAKSLLENFVIAACIQDYISEAKLNLLYVQQSWATAVMTDRDSSAALIKAINEIYQKQLNQITIVEYIVSKGSWDLSSSKAMYEKLLNVVCDADNGVALKAVKGVEYADYSSAVAVYGADKAWFNATAATGVKPFSFYPVNPATFTADALDITTISVDTYCAGSASVEMDQVVNANLYK